MPTRDAVIKESYFLSKYKLDNLADLIAPQRAVKLRMFLREVERMPYFKPKIKLRETPNLRLFYSDTQIGAFGMARGAMDNQLDLPDERTLISRLEKDIRGKGKFGLYRALQIAGEAASCLSWRVAGDQPTELLDLVAHDASEMAKSIVLWDLDVENNSHVKIRYANMRIWDFGYGSAGFRLVDGRVVHYAFSENFNGLRG
ncbi:TPA: hypothetical protein HA291_04415 [Candidatus Micrarchaeota archaeon]|nr:hypothetical protein [Candidatus Micrarchaeota archaeon]